MPSAVPNEALVACLSPGIAMLIPHGGIRGGDGR